MASLHTRFSMPTKLRCCVFSPCRHCTRQSGSTERRHGSRHLTPRPLKSVCLVSTGTQKSIDGSSLSTKSSPSAFLPNPQAVQHLTSTYVFKFISHFSTELACGPGKPGCFPPSIHVPLFSAASTLATLFLPLECSSFHLLVSKCC